MNMTILQDLIVFAFAMEITHSEFLGEDVKIKFIFDTEDEYHDVTYPFSTNLRNISLSTYDNNDMKEEEQEVTLKPDRRDLQPGRSLVLGMSVTNSLSDDSGLDLSTLAQAKVNVDIHCVIF